MSNVESDRPSTRKVSAWLAILGIVLGVSFISWGINKYLVDQAIEEGRPRAEERTAQRERHDKAQARVDTLETVLGELSARLDENPTDSMLVISAANIAYDLARYAEAERYYNLFLENIDPSNVAARIDLSFVTFQQGRTEEAFEMLHKVIKQEPSNQTAMFNLAYLYDQSGQQEEALDWMTKCRDADPTSQLGKQAIQVIESIE